MAESKRGGRRQGAGRKKGVVSIKKRVARQKAEIAIANAKKTPLEYMLEVMLDAGADVKRRDAMAVAAAAFVHPRLSSIDGDLNLHLHKHEQALDELE